MPNSGTELETIWLRRKIVNYTATKISIVDTDKCKVINSLVQIPTIMNKLAV